MDVQLLLVLALVALSALFLGYRMFGSLARNAKSPGCSGCAISACCEPKQKQECKPAESLGKSG